MAFSDQTATPAPPVKPTPDQLKEMKAVDDAAKAQVKKMNSKPAKKMRAGGMVRGDGCASKGKTKGRHC